MKTVILTICISLLIGCNEYHKKNKLFKLADLDRFTFIETTNKETVYYAEIKFLKNKTLIIYSELDGQLGPYLYNYNQSKNTLTFNRSTFNIIDNTDGSIALKNNKTSFLLYKILQNKDNINKNQINPMYIRRCYFLVQLNIITTDDALKYLSKIDTLPNDSILEEKIFSNKK